METPNNEAKVLSLTERLKQATLTKEPGSNVTPTLKQEPVKPEPKPVIQKRSSDAWNSKDDFETTDTPAANTTTTPAASGTPNTQPTGPVKPTHHAKMVSARAAVGMLDMTQGMIFKPLVNYKFKKKFSKDELKRIPDVDGVNKALLGDEDQRLRTKLDKLLKKYDRQINSIPLTGPEESDLTKTFYNYFDLTETTFSPGYALAIGLVNTIGKRAIDIAFD